MPKPATKPWTDDEINKFLKSRGHTPQIPGAPSPSGTAAATPEATGFPPRPGVLEQIRSFFGGGTAPVGRAPTYNELGWMGRAGQGAAREAASLGIGATRLAGQVLPTGVRRTLGQAAESIPGIKRMEEFAAARPEGPGELVGSLPTDIAAGGFMPNLGLGGLAARAVPATREVPTMARQVLPTWSRSATGGLEGTMAPQWVGGTTMVQNPRAVAAARKAGEWVETAGKGAVGGAVTNPDDPEAGAQAGALGALGGRAVGAGLRSPVGQWIGSHGARFGTGMAAEEMMRHAGVSPWITGPVGLGYLAHQYNSPVGSVIGQTGKAAFDSAGRFLGYLPATVGGETARATSGRPMITIPRRAEPPQPFELPDAPSEAGDRPPVPIR